MLRKIKEKIKSKIRTSVGYYDLKALIDSNISMTLQCFSYEEEQIENVPRLTSQICNSVFCNSVFWKYPFFKHWAELMKFDGHVLMARLWEYVFIVQALFENGYLKQGAKGLGFGVGSEPLSALFAYLDCEIIASDLGVETKMVRQWFARNQHPGTDVNNLNLKGICPKDKFLKNVSYRTVNMNNIPCDLKGFDFCWSCSAVEHLGGKEKSFAHILKSLETLKPGGLLVFTTDYNLTSDVETDENPYCYLFTQRDLSRLTDELVSMGHYVYPLDLLEGQLLTDKFVDVYPYIGKIQLRKLRGKYLETPIGIIVKKRK